MLSLSIYHGLQSYNRVKSYCCTNLPRAFMFNFERLDILCAWIGHPSKSLRLFQFFENFHCSFFSDSIHDEPHTYIRLKSYGSLNLPRAFMLNFKGLDILCAWVGHPSEKLWPFEFLESIRCLILSVSIYHGPQSYTHVNSSGRFNWTRASVFNFEHLDILCAWVGHPSKKFWPFEFLGSFRCSFFSVLIYHGPQSYNQLKSNGRLNWTRAFVFNFKSLDVLCAWIGHPSERLWPFEFLERLHCSFSSLSIYRACQSYNRVKSYGRMNLPRAFVFNFERLNILCAWIGHPS